MTAKTITFAVQIGSRGFEIARLVAERLKYRYYDWEVTSEAAREAGVSPDTVAAAEQVPSIFKRIMERLLAASAYAPDDTSLEGPNAATMAAAIRTLTSEDYRDFIESVVKDLGDEGDAVIVGHASQVVLQGESGVLKVLIRGSRPVRAQRLAEEEGLGKDEALAAVQRSDRERVSFFKQIYHIDLLDSLAYDLTLNTDRLPLDTAADLVLLAASTLSP